jgi:hypothetical protein
MFKGFLFRAEPAGMERVDRMPLVLAIGDTKLARKSAR